MVQVAWAGSQWDLQGVGRVSAAESRLGDMPPSPLHGTVPRQDEGDTCQDPKHRYSTHLDLGHLPTSRGYSDGDAGLQSQAPHHPG